MKILAAMSGGVDSSVAATMLARSGHAVLGAHLRLRREQAGAPLSCTGALHAEDARRVAEREGFPFETLDLYEAFEREITKPFIEAYLGGQTPNPCVRCNSHIKFGPLMEWAARDGFDKVATGHYARCEFDAAAGRWSLRRAADPSKDQSYYLAGLNQAQLARLMFPLGDKTKEETRALAREMGLEVADKPDSMDICLTAGAKNDYRGFLAERLEGRFGAEGAIVDTRGKILGRHEGLAAYTIGQRKGLGISHERPLYVLELRPESNTVVVGEEQELGAVSLVAGPMNWISMADPSGPEGPIGSGLSDEMQSDEMWPGEGWVLESIRAAAQIRYRHKPSPCTLTPLADGMFRVAFDEPQRAIAPGQIAVFYEGDMVLCAGKIQRPSM